MVNGKMGDWGIGYWVLEISISGIQGQKEKDAHGGRGVLGRCVEINAFYGLLWGMLRH